MIGLGVGLMVSVVLCILVWVTTEDLGDTLQLGVGLAVLVGAAGVATRRLSGLTEATGNRPDSTVGPTMASPGWLWASVTGTGQSEWQVHSRARPAGRELAIVLLQHRHGLVLDDPDDHEKIRSLVGEPAWEILRPDRPPPSRRSRRRDGSTQLEALVSGLEAL